MVVLLFVCIWTTDKLDSLSEGDVYDIYDNTEIVEIATEFA